MRFCDEGVVLGGKAWGNSQYVVTILTRDHGCCRGLLGVGRSTRLKAALRGGTCVRVSWQGRLEEHLGRWDFEDIESLSSKVWEDGVLGVMVELMSGLVKKGLAERDIQRDFYDKTRRLVGLCGEERKIFLCGYSLWELELLSVVGMGLDRERCAVTGARDSLCYISPRTGCAVSREGAGSYAPRLLGHPDFWSDEGLYENIYGCEGGKERKGACEKVEMGSIVDGLRTTGYFLGRYGFLEGICGVLRLRVMEALEEVLV